MKTEIEWTDDGVSKEYTRDEARVLMAANPLTRWEPENKTGYYVMSKGGMTHFHGEGGHHTENAALMGNSFQCVGCNQCFPCYPSDESECPDCGRPLDPYPHYYRYDAPGGPIYRRADGPQCVVNILESGKEVQSTRSEQWHKDNDNYTRITEQGARDQADAPELTDAMRVEIFNYMKQLCDFNFLWGWVGDNTLKAKRNEFNFEVDIRYVRFTDNPVAELNALCDEVETEYKRHLADQVRDAVEGGE